MSSSIEQNPFIYGGEASPSCAWPATAHLRYSGWFCTGTLVHPEIIMTAGHCADSESGRNASVRFGEDPGEGGSYNATCYSNPPWLIHKNVGPDDFGYCRLDEPITSISPVPIAMGCEVEQWIRADREIYLVGFGESDNGGTGTKRQVKTVISAVGEDAANLGESDKGACQGDSGGPAYIRLPEGGNGQGSWRVFGITSGGQDPCGSGPATYVLQNHAVPWVEEHSKVDITPCHEADGTWNPTQDCRAFPLSIDQSHGEWSSGCEANDQTGWINTCGEPFQVDDANKDTVAPSIDWLHPQQGDTFDSENGAAEVSFSALANDKDGSGIESVYLVFSDKVLEASQLDFAPFEWKLQLKPGVHEIKVLARDRAGNESTSEAMIIGIDEAVPEPSPSTESSNTSPSSDNATSSNGGCKTVPSHHQPSAIYSLGLIGLLLARKRHSRVDCRSSRKQSPS